jgi:hypothetical protein
MPSAHISAYLKAAHPAASAAGGVMTYEGGTTSATVTSGTSDTAVATITGLTIPAAKPIMVICSFKGDHGASSTKSAAVWKYNAHIVMSSFRDCGKDGATASEVIQTTFLNPRIAGYEMGGAVFSGGSYGDGTSSVDRVEDTVKGASNKNATSFGATEITTLVIGAKTTHASGHLTLGFCAIYSFGVA